jgi:hypothetical protein
MANKNAMGTVISKNVGMIKTKSLPTWINGTPRLMTNSINFNSRPINKINVKASSPRKKGGSTSEIRYLISVFRFTVAAC